MWWCGSITFCVCTCVLCGLSTQNARTHVRTHARTPNVMLPHHHIDFLHFSKVLESVRHQKAEYKIMWQNWTLLCTIDAGLTTLLHSFANRLEILEPQLPGTSGSGQACTKISLPNTRAADKSLARLTSRCI